MSSFMNLRMSLKIVSESLKSESLFLARNGVLIGSRFICHKWVLKYTLAN